MNRERGVTVAVMGIGIAVVLAACTGTPTTDGAGTSAGNPAGIELPAKSLDPWVMPLDEFLPPTAGALPLYAENLLVADCLGESGIHWPIPWQPTDDAAYAPDYPVGTVHGLTVLEAQELGYNPDMSMSYRTDEEFRATLKELNGIAASTPGFEALAVTCRETAREELGDPTGIYGQQGNVMNWVQAAGDPRDAPEVIKTSAEWRECMSTAGYANTPKSPLDMSESLETFGITRPSLGPDVPLPPPSTAEIALAVADATCQESSGWTQAIYDAQWDIQVKVLSEHADELVRMRDQWSKDREVLLQIIAEHAPAR